MKDIVQNNISKLIKLIKYILIGLIVILSTTYIPDTKLQSKEIMMIGATSSIAFAILDMISPTIIIKKIDSKKQKVLVEA
jgi:hypothetical protein